jgi:hypothetical protein
MFEERVSARGPGAPSNQDADLLRAMLLFACAGLDSMIKHLIRDALPTVIDRVDNADDNFKGFVEKRFKDIDPKLLTAVLTSRDPRKALIEEMIKDLTSQSLQSQAQVLRTGAAFDLRSNELIQDMRLADAIFRVRNVIVHEMDIDFGQPNRNRTPRPKAVMVEYTQAILDYATRFMSAVDRKLQTGR